MARILVINPNASEACSAGISAALASLRYNDGPLLDVVTMRDGPLAIYSWQDWHGVVTPLCQLIQQEPADAYIIACASDPGLDAARAITPRPVFGIFRSAVAVAVARAERFGIIALADASVARHRHALCIMGLYDRLAAEVPLNVAMETLLDPDAARAALIDAGIRLRQHGAETIILGCTGMAHHRSRLQAQVGLPVIEPAQAAASLAIGTVIAEPA